MLSQFPRFRRLLPDDYHSVVQMVRRHPPYSDFNASCLWSWDIEDRLGTCLLNDNLVIRFSDYADGSCFYSFIGESEPNATAATLIEHSLEEGLESTLHLIPDSVARKLDPACFDVQEDPDQSDYVLSVDALCKYEGGRFASKRNEMNKFCRKNGNIVFQLADFDEPNIFKECRALFRDWQKVKAEKGGAGHHREFEAFKRCIAGRRNADLFGAGIWIEGKLRAFSLCEVGHDGYGFVHFEKADTVGFPGILAFLTQRVAMEFSKRGIKYLNIEQDLGIPGLRANKLSYAPCHVLKKYSVRLLDRNFRTAGYNVLTAPQRESSLTSCV